MRFTILFSASVIASAIGGPLLAENEDEIKFFLGFLLCIDVIEWFGKTVRFVKTWKPQSTNSTLDDPASLPL
jgi:hypothetical protein